MRWRWVQACALGVVLAALASGDAARAQVVHPWERLGATLEGTYAFPNTLFHVGAVAATVPLVLWVDEPVQRAFQAHDPLTRELGYFALVAGVALPIGVPAALYFGGLLAEDDELATAGAAVTQAAVIQLVIVHALKWLTDRAGPFPDGDPSRDRGNFARDSKSAKDFDFNPFDLRWGIRWPSGHTAASFAVAASLASFYPDEPWLIAVGYPLAAVIGIGMVEGDYHWLSDVVAGALIGHVIGWTVGDEFRATYEARKQGKPAARATGIRFAPSVEPLGIRVVGLM